MPKSKPASRLQTETQSFKDSESRGYFVVKQNDIIQKSKFRISKNDGESLTLQEQKILLFVISRIKPDDTELKEQIFDIAEFCRVCGIQASGKNYTNLKDAILRLRKRTMWLSCAEYDTTVSWIDKAYIYPKSGKIKIRLDEDLKPYLIMLRQNYTIYPLHSIIKMKTKYGIMLYELLKSYLYLGMFIEFPIIELKESLDCSNYDSFTNFKKRVIEPAVNDINTYSELKIEMEYKKEGRSFSAVVFHITDLSKSKKTEEQEEASRRFHRVENEIFKEEFFDISEPGGKENGSTKQ